MSIKEESMKEVLEEEAVIEKKEKEEEEMEFISYRFIKVSSKAKWFNFLIFPIMSFMSAFFYTFLFDFQTQFILLVLEEDSSDYHKKVERADSTTQMVILFGFLILPWISRNSMFRRRFLISLGFFFQFIAFMIIPDTINVYFQYGFAYVLFHIGLFLIFSFSLLSISQLVHQESVGKFISVVAAFGIIGMQVGDIFRLQGVKNMCIDWSYRSLGFFALFMSLLSFFALKNDIQIKKEKKIETYKALLKDRVFRLLTFIGMFAIGASMVTRFFLAGYLARDFNAREVCDHQSIINCFTERPIPGIGPCLLDIQTSDCGEDLTDYNSYGCPFGFPTFEGLNDEVAPMFWVALVFFLFVSDVVPALLLVPVNLIFAMVAFGFAFKVENMSDGDMKTGVRLWSISGLSSVLIWINLFLKTVEDKNEEKAVSLMVSLSMFGAFITHGMGGYLFGTQSLNAPWYVVFGATFPVFFISLYTIFKEYYKQKEEEKEEELVEEEEEEEEGAIAVQTL